MSCHTFYLHYFDLDRPNWENVSETAGDVTPSNNFFSRTVHASVIFSADHIFTCRFEWIAQTRSCIYEFLLLSECQTEPVFVFALFPGVFGRFRRQISERCKGISIISSREYWNSSSWVSLFQHIIAKLGCLNIDQTYPMDLSTNNIQIPVIPLRRVEVSDTFSSMYPLNHPSSSPAAARTWPEQHSAVGELH